MNKTEVIKEVAKRTGVTHSEAKKIVEATLDVISEHLTHGDEVQFLGFGRFGLRKRKERQGIHPKTGESIRIAAATTPVFVPGKKLKTVVMARGLHDDDDDLEKTNDPGEFIKGIKR
ncbi:HU family DNA-binding protein [Vibrio cholerae]|nr:HU family DNA-binding protein [Vibrio cholerae]